MGNVTQKRSRELKEQLKATPVKSSKKLIPLVYFPNLQNALSYKHIFHRKRPASFDEIRRNALHDRNFRKVEYRP